MRTDEFDYELPPDLIAQEPAPEREQARMMLISRPTGAIAHHRVADLPRLLRPGDLLVLNDTRVFPARLFGRKAATGGRVELLLVEEIAPDEWTVLWRATRRPRPGHVFELADGRIQATVTDEARDHTLRVRMHYEGAFMDILESHGRTPLPPYIKRSPATEPPDQSEHDRRRYQTVYARQPGAVAAPTAGLHFTESLLASLAQAGITTAKVTLHVGPGTFRPVTAENIEDHRMDAERYIITPAAADAVNATRRAGGRVVAVGSTVVRTLETAATADDEHPALIQPGAGRSALFIRPPYQFRVVDAMLTNFHLPASTLLMMVSALAGLDLTRRAYALAIAERYRFYSFGDCMLIT